jgi:hypothetical protein
MRARPRNSRLSVLFLSAAVTAAGAPWLTGAPAEAVSATLTYHCTTPSASYDLGAVVDTNAPATLVVQQSASLVATSTVTLPDAITASLRAAGATNVSGNTQLAEIVNGTTRSLFQTVLKTAVPASGALRVTGSSTGGTIRGVSAGTPVVITAGNLNLSITGYDDSGAVKLATVDLTCQLSPTGQNALMDNVPVLPIPTTTAIEVRVSPIEYGTAAKVVVKVSKAGTSAKPDGTVALTTNGTTVSAPVANGRAVATLPAALKMGTNSVTGAFTPSDKNVAPSQGSVSYSVVRGTTSMTTLLTLRDTRHKLIGTSLVTSANGTDVSGKVRFTLFKDGRKIRTATVTLTKLDRARGVFQRIRKPGTYVLQSKNLGSPSLKRSKTQTKLRINDPNAF